MLFYLFAEPMARGDQTIAADDHKRHRDEITNFAARVAGDEVSFGSASYREWLRGAVGLAANHAAALIARFNPGRCASVGYPDKPATQPDRGTLRSEGRLIGFSAQHCRAGCSAEFLAPARWGGGPLE
jgi:hypothetical protein